MAHGIATIHVRTRQKHVHVVGFGKTNRGTKFIAADKELTVTKMASKNFKNEMAAAVAEMLAQQVMDI